MRVLAKITVPVESGNQGVRDGRIAKLVQATAERWKPEAMYFGAPEGRRAGFVVFDVPDASDLIPFWEPSFQELNADVGFIPVMSGDDMQKGFAKLG